MAFRKAVSTHVSVYFCTRSSWPTRSPRIDGTSNWTETTRPISASLLLNRYFSSATQESLDGAIYNGTNMEAFIDNIHLKHKIQSDKNTKIESKKENFRKAADDHRLQKLQKARNFFPQADRRSVSASFESVIPINGPPAPAKDKIVGEPEAEYRKLQEWEGKEIAPPVKELLHLASFFATAGHVDGVRLVQNLLRLSHEDTYRSEMRLEHYLANALGNARDYHTSCDLFKRLFYDYPVKRRKLSNMFRFTMLRVLNEYPAVDTLPLVYDFVEFAVRLDENMPALHLWQALFRHSSPAASTEAYQLLKRYPRLRKMVTMKLDSLMMKARDAQDTVFLFRLLTLLDSLDLPEKDAKHFTGCLYDVIMDVYCSHEDLVGAKQILRLAEDRAKASGKVFMWPDTVKRYIKASGLVKIEVYSPDANLKSRTVPLARAVKFKF